MDALRQAACISKGTWVASQATAAQPGVNSGQNLSLLYLQILKISTEILKILLHSKLSGKVKVNFPLDASEIYDTQTDDHSLTSSPLMINDEVPHN